MKNKNNAKFLFQKFEIAKLGKKMITGGDNTGDPDTVTDTSNNCSKTPRCKRPGNDPKPLPTDPDLPPQFSDLC